MSEGTKHFDGRINGHDVRPDKPGFGPAFGTEFWRCNRCEKASSDLDYFKRSACPGFPELIGGA